MSDVCPGGPFDALLNAEGDSPSPNLSRFEHVARVMRISEAERESEHEIAARVNTDEIASLVSGADSSSDLEVRWELGLSHFRHCLQAHVLQSTLAMPPHDKTPNMKLVMNPEGKVHDWTELEDQEQLPEIMQHVSRGRQKKEH